MADLRIVDAPEIPTENITGEEKLPTGGNGNYSISLDSLADYTKTKKDLADNTSVDNKVNGVRQELDTHIEDLLNPHQVTKGQIGLGNVDNTADADKPVSNSTQAAIISAVAPKADKTYVDNQLTLKANKADVYTKSETYTKQESDDLVNNSISTALTPVNTSLDLAKRGVINRYDPSLTYNSGERVVLANGDIVKSTIDGNANDPNVVMTGWDNPIKYIKTQVSFYATPENFGAKVNDPSFDSYEYLQAWLYSGLSLRIGVGVYYTSKPLIVLPSTQILGAGLRTSNIQKTTNDTISFEYFTPTGDSVIKDIDAVFILKQDNVTRYSDRLDMRGFTLAKTWGLDNSTKENPSFGIFAPYVSESSFQNISVLDVYHPIYAINVWMVTMLRVQGHGAGGWVLGGSDGDALRGGTSITALSCWSTAVRGDNFSYNLNNLHYSSFTNCGSDSVGLDGQPASGIWYIKDCTIGIRNTACEVVHAYKYLKCSNSNIEFSGITFEAFFNKYGGISNHLFQLDAYSTVSIKNSKLLFVYNVGEVPNVSNFAIANEFSEFYLSESEVYPRVSGVSNGTSFEVAIGAQSYAKIEGKGGSIEFCSGDNTWIPSANNSHYTSSNTLITGASKGYFGASNPLAGQWSTNIFRIGAVRIWFSPTKEVLLYKLYSDPESDLDGIEFSTRSDGMRGTTAQRPSSSWCFIGLYFFDTTINKPVWWNGLNWTDSDGAVV